MKDGYYEVLKECILKLQELNEGEPFDGDETEILSKRFLNMLDKHNGNN